jgi:predicted glycogen debranching enzyme
MYEGYPDLHLQLSKKHEYIHAPGWFYNIEYLEDQKAEQPFQEDLFVPGFFELNLKLGETIIFSASTKEEQFASLRSKFTQEVKKRIPRNTFENCLINAAQQFIKTRNNKTEVIAGYPSFGVSGRDALIALPGITLYTDGSESIFLDAFDNLTSELNNDIFAALAKKGRRSADIPLWYIWTLQEYVNYKQSSGGIWKKYGGILTEILNTYRNGVDSQIYMTENKLIWASQPGMPLTWMDLIVDGVPMTQRAGYAVEVNALWYNAVCFALDIAKKAKAKEFVSEWKDYPEQIAGSFETIFWNEQQRYLYDFVNEKSDPSIRPNMLFAVSLPFSPLKTSQKSAVIDTVRNHLFTKKGLRTLSPRNPNYNGMPSENRQHARMVYHQGNIFPWLGGHFVTAQLNLKGKAGLPDALMFYHEFEKEMTRKGMGTISEYFHGNPPHEGRGAISQAWNTAELLRLKHTLLKYQD